MQFLRLDDCHFPPVWVKHTCTMFHILFKHSHNPTCGDSLLAWSWYTLDCYFVSIVSTTSRKEIGAVSYLGIMIIAVQLLTMIRCGVSWRHKPSNRIKTEVVYLYTAVNRKKQSMVPGQDNLNEPNLWNFKHHKNNWTKWQHCNAFSDHGSAPGETIGWHKLSHNTTIYALNQ